MKPLYCLVYTFIFMGFGVMGTLIGPYLDGIGFTGQQIGVVTAAGTCTAVFASPFWGHRYAMLRSRNGRHLLVSMVFCGAAVTGLLLSQVTVFFGFLGLFVLLSFFQSPSSALMDTLTIDEGERFGQVRTFGAVGFAVACFGAAYIADAMGLKMIFPIYTGCLLTAIVLVFVIRSRGAHRGQDPEIEELLIVDSEGSEAGEPNQQRPEPGIAEERDPAGPTEEPLRAAQSGATEQDPVAVAGEDTELAAQDLRGKGSRRMIDMARELAANRAYVLLLICAFFINGTDIANNTYFSFLYLEGGGTLAGVGVAFLLMAGSEAPFMAASDRLCDRFGQGRILLIAMVFSIVRFGLFALGLPNGVLLALFPLQGLVNGITLVEFVKFVARVVPRRLRGLGITVYYALGSSFSTIICQLIGGRLLDHGMLALSGPRSVYLFFTLFNIAGVVIFLAARLHKK